MMLALEKNQFEDKALRCRCFTMMELMKMLFSFNSSQNQLS